MRVHFASVLRPECDSTNGGVTSVHDRVALAHSSGAQSFEALALPVLYAVEFMGHLVAVPEVSEKGTYQCGRWMFGGNFLWSSDSSFRALSPHPIPVFDRTESASAYVHAGHFPRYDLVALKNAASLLEEITHMLATDSDLDSVTAAGYYADLAVRAKETLRALGSATVHPDTMRQPYRRPVVAIVQHPTAGNIVEVLSEVPLDVVVANGPSDAPTDGVLIDAMVRPEAAAILRRQFHCSDGRLGTAIKGVAVPAEIANRQNDEDVLLRFRNHYKCERCRTTWHDEWDSQCDDDCPQCGCTMTPFDSEDIESSVLRS